MKAFLLIITMAALFAVGSLQNAEAQPCPPGYNYTTIIVDVAGCLYEAEVCYNCDYLTHGNIDISVVGFSQYFGLPGEPCDNGLHAGQITAAIIAQVQNPDFLRDFCYEFMGVIPDCPSYSPTITFKSYICWDIEYVVHQNEGELLFQPCDTSTYCITIYRYCRDRYGKIIEYVEGINAFGTVTCTKEAWEIQIPIDDGQKSDCYIYHSNCWW